ncbi:esterase LipI-like [Mya arenaria]|uniref:esterase LipI-like n=1 Tax=Mya arenaria TaxID=6604 RepID=UPI0022E81EEA|nr:esterase LipI-like [Mya arenaria]
MPFNLDEFLLKYAPHEETVSYLRAKYSGDKKEFETDVDAARRSAVETARRYAGDTGFDGTTQEFSVPVDDERDIQDAIPVTVYKPDVCVHQGAPPLLVYFHGGGNVTKSRATQETTCKMLAKMTPCIVVNVEYRRSPEHKFPASNDDASCVTRWVHENKIKIGGSVSSRLGVAGDSNGGRMAAVVCHDCPSIVHFAILVYPKVSYLTEFPSSIEFQDGPLLPRKRSEWFSQMTLREDQKTDPRASVVLNSDFSRLPPTLLVIAELDPLRDGGYEYERKLRDAGVHVELELIKGVPHTFWSLPVAFKENCTRSYEIAAKFIRKVSTSP